MLPFNVWAQSLWETLYMVILSTAISYLIGLPLGMTLVVTDKNGIRPMPVLNTVLGIVTNILRSIPFLILAVMITPVTRAIVGKAIGTTAMIVPLTFAAAPYVARMVESSIKEVDKGVIEAAEAMGTPRFQIITKVLVPEAKPSLITGAVISMVTVLGYSAMAATIGGTGLGQIAINYGGRDEIVRAVKKLSAKVQSGEVDPAGITADTLEGYLDTAGIPDPDLLIRTCNEQRISNFLLWQLAYTEFYFTPVPWPDFTKEELIKAVEAYNHRDRRYGGLKEE